MTKRMDMGKAAEGDAVAASKLTARRELIRRLATAAAAPAVVAAVAGMPRPAAAY